MPGFLMHLTEGEMILSALEKKAPRYDEHAKQFLLGCILPDITTDKELTHFRPKSQTHLINKYPDMTYVMERYGSGTLSPIDLGILAHLQLDASYVTEFWPQHFEFQMQDKTPSTDVRNDLFVNVFNHPEHRIPLADFFSLNYFYGDYDIINPILIETFHPFIPMNVPYSEKEIHIKECIPKSPSMVNDMLKRYAPVKAPDADPASSCAIKQSVVPTKTLPYPDILAFLEQQADVFARWIFQSNQFGHI